MRQFIHELRHGRFEREEGANMRQVGVEQHSESVVVAGLRGTDDGILVGHTFRIGM